MSSLLETPEYLAAARFVELTLEKRAIKLRLKELDAQLRTLEPALVGYLSAAAIPSLPVKNYSVETYREPWIYPVTGVSRPMVCEALKISGLHRMVAENYSTQALTRYVKDLEAHHKLITGLQPGTLQQILPPALAHILHVEPAFGIRVQKKARAYAEEYDQEIQEFNAEQETPDEPSER